MISKVFVSLKSKNTPCNFNRSSVLFASALNSLKMPDVINASSFKVIQWPATSNGLRDYDHDDIFDLLGIFLGSILENY